ncbi:MAG: hypothetical protein ACI4JK_07315 [Oscillospiraceae bacterium]
MNVINAKVANSPMFKGFNGIADLQVREKQIDRDVIRAKCENGGELAPGNYGSFIVLETGKLKSSADKNSVHLASQRDGVYNFQVDGISSATAKKYAEFGTSYSRGDSFEVSADYESNRNKYVMNDPYDYHGITTHKFNNDTGLYDRYLNGKYIKSVDNKYDAYGYRSYAKEREDLDQAYFFHADLDFLFDAAKEYAKIDSDQDYVYRAIQDDSFVRSTIDWFTQGMGGELYYKNMQKSIDDIVKELAEKIRNGEDTSFDKLNSKLNIVGEEVSVSKLMDIQKKSLELSEKMGVIGYGTDKLADNAKWGIIKSQGIALGNQIGGKLGRLYSSAFSAEADLHVKKCYDTMKPGDLKKFITYGEEIYNLFGNDNYSENVLDDILQRFNNASHGMADTIGLKEQINKYVLSI